ncbi:GntR family transcriptional regulator [Aureimonas sp. SA4125]|uniref:GntR family transcriptional regulator n=1 Tax=Aureimonas sp. SA4125 TaxID=2826993 RepID=UPI001CC4DC95|nr:GntR family transcriptional regulator [Aureimonas sp. SA4125]
MAEKVTRVSRVTLSEVVYRDIRELLLAGQVAPGEKFTLRGLAEAVGTSPMPVREAVGRLSAEGGLEILPNRAIRVPIMTRERFAELTIIRAEIEGLAAQYAAERAAPHEIAAACGFHMQFAAVSAEADPDGAAALKLNKDMHFAVYRAAHMPNLLQIIDGLWLQVGPVINLDLRASGRRLKEVEAHKHHARLVAALKDGDGAAARQALADDIRTAADFILATGDLPSATRKG